jgi:hypothetical protein
MAIVYNWVVSSMDEYPTNPEGLTDVVFNVHWRRTATETIDNKRYYADIYDVLKVAQPDPENFIPYEDLTFEQVCGWLDTGIDREALDTGLASQIENQINPPVISLPLPWDTDPV